MTPAKRKPQQGLAEPDEQETVATKTAKQKPKREEMMLPNEEEQNIGTKTPSPALTVNIYSWATPIVGIIMLVIGALAGFYARPTVLGQLPESTSGQSPVVAIPTEDRSEAQQQLMDSLIPRVRHFLGDPNAPVALIEFGDFQ